LTATCILEENWMLFVRLEVREMRSYIVIKTFGNLHLDSGLLEVPDSGLLKMRVSGLLKTGDSGFLKTPRDKSRLPKVASNKAK
jgi:hypothetical protein